MLFNKRNCGMGMQNPWMGGCCPQMNPCCCDPQVTEPTITKCIEKDFYHEVPHDC